jgi:hypothetical protein
VTPYGDSYTGHFLTTKKIFTRMKRPLMTRNAIKGISCMGFVTGWGILWASTGRGFIMIISIRRCALQIRILQIG